MGRRAGVQMEGGRLEAEPGQAAVPHHIEDLRRPGGQEVDGEQESPATTPSGPPVPSRR